MVIFTCRWSWLRTELTTIKLPKMPTTEQKIRTTLQCIDNTQFQSPPKDSAMGRVSGKSGWKPWRNLFYWDMDTWKCFWSSSIHWLSDPIFPCKYATGQNFVHTIKKEGVCFGQTPLLGLVHTLNPYTFKSEFCTVVRCLVYQTFLMPHFHLHGTWNLFALKVLLKCLQLKRLKVGIQTRHSDNLTPDSDLVISFCL